MTKIYLLWMLAGALHASREITCAIKCCAITLNNICDRIHRVDSLKLIQQMHRIQVGESVSRTC